MHSLGVGYDSAEIQCGFKGIDELLLYIFRRFKEEIYMDLCDLFCLWGMCKIDELGVYTNFAGHEILKKF